MNLLGDSSQKIDTREIAIKENIIAFADHSIQISNISQLTAGMPPNKMPFKAIILAVICLLAQSLIGPLGTIGLLCCLGYIGYIVWENLNKGAYISLRLNSGFTFNIVCKDEAFANNIRHVIETCINHAGTYAINMDQCIIQADTLINGDGNEVSLSHENI
ncbi:hypothetical protein [Listeria ilorinensis]|uniref:hypothetical protein n=1 Tax=Listeria ilorinensis TaxID=2867439 RepID=UPI001EF5116D|nr:hypothetical protein [Listeria ilorinensis]